MFTAHGNLYSGCTRVVVQPRNTILAIEKNSGGKKIPLGYLLKIEVLSCLKLKGVIDH